MYGIALIIIIVATLGQTLAGQDLSVNIFGVLIFWRFILGVGIGGDHSVTTIIASEFANKEARAGHNGHPHRSSMGTARSCFGFVGHYNGF